MSEEINTTKHLKLFSSNQIWIATFFGGPLAFGYMINKNYSALGQDNKGKNIFIICVIFTILLFSSLFLLPESIIDKIPRTLLPITYTAAGVAYVESTQGKILKKHKESGNKFYSGWSVFVTSIIAIIPILLFFVAAVFILPQNEMYDIEITKFSKNEEETLVFYDNLDTKSRISLLKDLETIIPKWEENIQIINKVDQLEDLPNKLKEQNKILLEYSELRLKTFEIFEKAIYEDTDKYTDELEELHLKINKTLEKLQ